MVKSITREILKQRLDGGGLVLLEALPAQYYEHAHLPGALRLNHDEVVDGAGALVPDRHAEIVVYCASETCPNSHIAAEILEQLGYTDVSVYAGGKKDWIEAGMPIVGKHAAEAA